MKKKELKDHKVKSPVELGKELQTRLDKLDGLRFDLAAGKVKNIREIRHLKQDIAQILTLIKAAANKKDHA